MSSDQQLIETLREMANNLETPLETPMYDKMESLAKEEKKEKLIKNGFYRNFPITDAKGNVKEWRREPDYYALADYIIDNFNIMTDDSYRLMYENNCYNHSSKTRLMNLICHLTLNKAKPNELDNFFKVVSTKAYKAKIDIEDPYRKINLSNGVYELETGNFVPHSSDNFFRYCLSHQYDHEAKCPNFEKYLNFVLQGDKETILLTQQMFGYILMGGDPIAHRAFLLYGDGRNGKSTLLDTMRYLIGDENCSAVSMKMIDKPFSMVQMDGKLANIVEESPAQIDAEAFKNIVGGGRITASYKGKDEFQMKINARLVFACNTLPTFKDATSGTNDRLIIIPFNKYIKPGERDTSIKYKIFNEISGILNWAIEGYNSFKANQYRFVEPKSVVDTLSEYRKETDTAYAWCLDNMVETKDENHFVIIDPLYEAYCQDCRSNTSYPISKRKFLQRLKKYYEENFSVKLESVDNWYMKKNRKSFFIMKCDADSYKVLFKNIAESSPKR